MAAIATDMEWDDFDDFDPNPRCVSSERIHRLLLDLQAGFEEAGWADPAVKDRLLAEMWAEPPEERG